MPMMLTSYIIFIGGALCAYAFLRIINLRDSDVEIGSALKCYILISLSLLIATSSVSIWGFAFVIFSFFAKRQGMIVLISAVVVMFLLPKFSQEVFVGSIFLGQFDVYKILFLSLIIFLPKKPLFSVNGVVSWGVLSFSILEAFASAREGNALTGFARGLVHASLTYYFPYLIVLSLVSSAQHYRQLIVAIVFCSIALFAPALYETIKRWNLYNIYYFYIDEQSPHLFQRFRAGFIRVTTNFINPICYGYFSAVALVLSISMLDRLKTLHRLGFILLLLFGCIVAFSKGPYMGLGVAFAYLFVILPQLPKFKYFGVFLLLLMGLSLTPLWEIILNLLPFIGDISPESESYRTLLLSQSLMVAQESLWLGRPMAEVYAHPEMQVLMQGQGIIDITNFYLQVLLELGIVGLALWVAINAITLWQLFRSAKKQVELGNSEEAKQLYVASAALLLSCVVIGVVSDIDRVIMIHMLTLSISQVALRIFSIDAKGVCSASAQRSFAN